MIKAILKKILPVLLLSYILSFLCIFCFLIIFPPAIMLANYQVKYILNQSFLHFLDFLIPINCTGLILAYSLFLTEDDFITKRGNIHPFHQVVSPLLVILLILTLIYSFLITWSYSVTFHSIVSIENKTLLVNDYLSKIKELRNTKNYQDILYLLDACLNLDAKNIKALELKEEIEKYLIEQDIPILEIETNLADQLPKEGFNINELLQKARNFFYKEDWFSAFYYASLANNLDPNQLEAAKLVRATTDKISSFELSIVDQEKRQIYIEKQKGYQSLLNKEYIAAYYTFKRLKTIIPSDQDIDIYLEMAKEKVEKFFFFYEETILPLSLPGIKNIFFLNSVGKPGYQFIFIEKMVKYDSKIYFKNIEVYQTIPNGKEILHLKAAFGKYLYADISMQNLKEQNFSIHNINLNCISKNNPQLIINPQYIVLPLNQEITNILPIAPDPDQLSWLTLNSSRYKTMGINELLKIKNNISIFGYPDQELNIEILSRLLMPFLFMLFAIFSIAIGWQFRSRYKNKPPLITIILLPVFPVIITIICKLLIYANRLLITFTVISFGFIISIIIACIFQFILLIISIFSVASQIPE